MVNCKHLTDCFFYLLSTFGIAYQVFRQSSAYLDYPVYSLLDNVHRSIRLPAITFCVSYWYSEVEGLMREKTVAQARQVFPNYSTVVLDCAVVLPNGSTVSCLSVGKVNRYMNANMACYSLFEARSTYLTDDELMYHEQLDTSFLFNVVLKSPLNFSNHWGFSVRPHDSPLTIFRSTESKIWVEPLVDSLTAAALSVSRRVELPYPYVSRCFDYSQTPYRELDNALQSCWIDKLKYNGTPLWPKWALYDFNLNYSRDLNGVHFAHGDLETQLFPAVNERCFKECVRTECDKETFFLRSVMSRKSSVPLRENNYTLQVVDVPRHYETITLKPRIHLATLINDIGNIISMWIGVAAYFSTVHLVDLVLAKGKPINSASTTPQIPSVPGETVRHFCIANFVVKFAFLILTFYFILDIILIYFENPFYTLLLSSIPSATQLSHLTICFNMTVNSDLTINQLLNSTLDWDTLFIPDKSVFISSETRKYERIIDYWNFTKSSDGDDVCVTSFGATNYISGREVPQYQRSLMLTAKTIDVKLNVSSIMSSSHIKIFYHRYPLFEESISAQNQIIVPINRDKRLYVNSYVFAPSMTRVELYRDHVSSECRNYREEVGVSDRLEAVHRCTIDTFVSTFNLWPSGYRSIGSNLTFHKSKYHSHALKDIRDECDKIYWRPDCVTVYQSLSVADNFFHPNYTSFIIYPTRKFLPVYRQMIKYTVFDIIGFTGGTLNSWIGLTVIDILKLTHRLRHFFLQRVRVTDST